MIANRWGLRDAIVVLGDDALATQTFRLGAKRISHRVDGLYCWPSAVPDAEREAVYLACQRAFNQHLARISSVERIPALAPSPLEAPAPRVPTGLFARQAVSRALLLAEIGIFAMTVADVHGGLHYLLGLVLGVAIIGWSVVGLLKLDNVALEIGLTTATSLSLVVVAAQILITTQPWHPIALEEVTCLICAPALLLQLRAHSAPGRST
jgi:hypothetical protein